MCSEITFSWEIIMICVIFFRGGVRAKGLLFDCGKRLQSDAEIAGLKQQVRFVY